MSRAFKTVVVGFGRIGAGYAHDPVMARYYSYATHAQALKDHPRFDWCGVVDPSEDALAEARREWGIPLAVRSIAELTGRCSPEVLVLATPPGQRVEALQACTSVKAVLVEKPLGLDLRQARAFARACHDRSLPVEVNYWRRFDRVFRSWAQGALAKRVGPVQAVFGVYGNGLHNNGSHLIDFCRMLFGEVTEVRALGSAAPTAAPLERDVHLPFSLRHQDGTLAVFQPLDFGAYRENGLEIWGRDGRITVSQEGLALRFCPRQPNRAMQAEFELASDHPEEMESTVGRAFYEVYDQLAALLDGQGTALSGVDSALKTEAAVEAAVRSAAAEGRPVVPADLLA